MIELLITIAIIGILASLVLVALNSSRNRAQDAQRKSNAHNLDAALARFYLDKSGYPADTNSEVADGIDIEAADNTCGEPLQSALVIGGHLSSGSTCQEIASNPQRYATSASVNGVATDYSIGWQLSARSDEPISTGNGTYQADGSGAVDTGGAINFTLDGPFEDGAYVFVTYGPQ